MKVEVVIKKRQKRSRLPKGTTRTMATLSFICGIISCQVVYLPLHGEQQHVAFIAFLVLSGLSSIFLLLTFFCLAERIGGKNL